jgi:hypothetical protein
LPIAGRAAHRDPKDIVATKEDIVVRDHDAHTLRGYCANFRSPNEDHIDFGWVRFIRPTTAHPEIRLVYASEGSHLWSARRSGEA